MNDQINVESDLDSILRNNHDPSLRAVCREAYFLGMARGVARGNAKVDAIVGKLIEIDDKFGHFARLHRPDDYASPSVLLGHVASMVRDATEAARKDNP